ncbi:MAG: DMT family transporter [Prevotellaceae bacterium]|nr:DMT family transporter [Prevotellaceae bacterium]
MWLLLAFLSAFLLGFYDVFKKMSLKGNPVIPVLFLNTLFCSLFFAPFIVLSYNTEMLDGSLFHVASGGFEQHRWIMLKSLIVLSSWVCGYVAMKNLPITIVGPVNATRPVMVLVGAMLVYGEHLNMWQWIGVLLAILSFFLLSRSGKKEGIRFAHNRWVYFLVSAAVLGAVSGLYDKFLMAKPENGGVGLDKMMVQSWFNIYQCVLMGGALLVSRLFDKTGGTPFQWRWSILGISLFICMADFAYFFSLSHDGAMISMVSMIRRGSVVVSFLFGAMIFREKNLKAKAFDMFLVLLGMLCIWIGSR